MVRQAEQRRLAWMAKQLDILADAEEVDPDLDLGPAPDTPGGRTAQRKLEKAARRLEVSAHPLPAAAKPRYFSALQGLYPSIQYPLGAVATQRN